MKKKIIISLITLVLITSNVFANSFDTASNNSTVSLEGLFGYSVNSRILKYSNDLAPVKRQQKNLSIGEKLTIYTKSSVSLTTSVIFNFVFADDSNLNITVSDQNLDPINSINYEYYSNSVNFFVGPEKISKVTKDLSYNIALGPNVLYYFAKENQESLSAFGIQCIANLNYNISPGTRLSFSINASYNPFLYKKNFDVIDETEEHDIPVDYYEFVSSINPTIGFIYSL